MSNEPEQGTPVFVFIIIAFLFGGFVGSLTVKTPEEILVFESHQPVRAIFVSKIPGSAEPESFTVTDGYGDDRREFIFYYWVESDAVDGYMRKQLHWTWREVTGP